VTYLTACCSAVRLTPSDPFSSSRSAKGASKTQRQQAARKQRSRAKGAASDFKWQGAWQHTWSDAARAQAAAAAQLDPEELHNLVFGQDEEDLYGSFSSGSSSKERRRQRREQRRRARRMQARAARERAAGSGFGYAEYAYWSEDDSDASSDEEDWWQAYGVHGQQQQQRRPQRQQQQQYWWGADGSGRPDWQWWTEEQER
jgi:hypothetical protein